MPSPQEKASALHKAVLRLPHTVSSSGAPLTAEMAKENQVFIATFIDNYWLQEYSNYQCIARPGHVTAGKAGNVVLNSHRVQSFPQKKIYQYDVSEKPPISMRSCSCPTDRHWERRGKAHHRSKGMGVCRRPDQDSRRNYLRWKQARLVSSLSPKSL